MPERVHSSEGLGVIAELKKSNVGLVLLPLAIRCGSGMPLHLEERGH